MKSVCKISGILILMTLFSFLFCPACFAGDEGAVITAEAPKNAAVGSTINVKIVLSGAEELYGGHIAISFDRKKLQIQSITAGNALSGLFVTTNKETEDYLSIITFASAQTTDVNGVIAEISFAVTAVGEAGIKIAEASFNDSLTSVIDFSVSNAAVSAYDGSSVSDVNGDGSEDLVDAVDILQYLDKKIIFDEETLSAADKDGNGVVDEADTAAVLKEVLKAK